MGQAKLRGTKEERVQQAKLRTQACVNTAPIYIADELPCLIVPDVDFEQDKVTKDEEKIDTNCTIACAAILTQEGTIFSVERPGRHHHIIKIMADAGRPTPIVGRQGFLLSDGTFVGRHKARQIAESNGQLLVSAINSTSLFSEDVW